MAFFEPAAREKEREGKKTSSLGLNWHKTRAQDEAQRSQLFKERCQNKMREFLAHFLISVGKF